MFSLIFVCSLSPLCGDLCISLLCAVHFCRVFFDLVGDPDHVLQHLHADPHQSRHQQKDINEATDLQSVGW